MTLDASTVDLSTIIEVISAIVVMAISYGTLKAQVDKVGGDLKADSEYYAKKLEEQEGTIIDNHKDVDIKFSQHEVDNSNRIKELQADLNNKSDSFGKQFENFDEKHNVITEKEFAKINNTFRDMHDMIDRRELAIVHRIENLGKLLKTAEENVSKLNYDVKAINEHKLVQLHKDIDKLST